VDLTDEGAAILPHARDLLATAQTIRTEAARRTPGTNPEPEHDSGTDDLPPQDDVT
jgi:hypothetical protein